MTHPLFDTGFYGRLRQQAGSRWHAYIGHDFCGNSVRAPCHPRPLPRSHSGLSVSAALRPCLGLLISKLSEPEALRSATASLNAIVSELPLHQAYCQQWGISEAAMASEPEAVETLNYTRYVLDVGHTGDALELLTALMPCVAGYAEIGLTLLHDPATRFEGNPYAAWIENYGDEAYLAGVRSSLSLFETLAGSVPVNTGFTRWRRFLPLQPGWKPLSGRWVSTMLPPSGSAHEPAVQSGAARHFNSPAQPELWPAATLQPA